MRILHVIQELDVGGAERIAVSLARGAHEAGHEVAVASRPGPLAREIPGPHFPLPLLERRPWRLPGAARSLDRAFRHWRPNLLHCHNPGMAAVASIATLRGRRLRALVSVHGVPEADWAAAARVLRLSGLPAVACGPGVSAALAEHGVEVHATTVNGISAAPNAVDPRTFASEFGLRSGQPVVLTVGRLVGAKNHALAIRALAGVREAALVVVGEGPERETLAGLAEDVRVADRVVLAGLRGDARSLMGGADAIVLTSRAEGLPLAALEALASGTPLVAVAVRGLRELLEDGKNAVLVPPDDPAALAEGLRRVLTERELAQRIGAGGRLLAQQYTEERMVSSFLDLYVRLAAS